MVMVDVWATQSRLCVECGRAESLAGDRYLGIDCVTCNEHAWFGKISLLVGWGDGIEPTTSTFRMGQPTLEELVRGGG